MLFAVFVAFYLWTDHAPWWLWVLAILGFFFDQWEERRGSSIP
jgi:hypothetical protein